MTCLALLNAVSAAGTTSWGVLWLAACTLLHPPSLVHSCSLRRWNLCKGRQVRKTVAKLLQRLVSLDVTDAIWPLYWTLSPFRHVRRYLCTSACLLFISAYMCPNRVIVPAWTRIRQKPRIMNKYESGPYSSQSGSKLYKINFACVTTN